MRHKATLLQPGVAAAHSGDGGDLDGGGGPLAQEEDPPPLGLIPDPLGALQPEGSAGGCLCTHCKVRCNKHRRVRANGYKRTIETTYLRQQLAETLKLSHFSHGHHEHSSNARPPQLTCQTMISHDNTEMGRFANSLFLRWGTDIIMQNASTHTDSA